MTEEQKRVLAQQIAELSLDIGRRMAVALYSLPSSKVTDTVFKQAAVHACANLLGYVMGTARSKMNANVGYADLEAKVWENVRAAYPAGEEADRQADEYDKMGEVH